ncbi:MAG: Fe-S cluster assembly protein SufD [Bacteroidota bacterium]
MIKSTQEHIDWYLSKFDLFEKSLNGESKSLIHTIRRDAISRFADMGFPTTKNEEWRFTNVSQIIGKDFKPVHKFVAQDLSPSAIERFMLKGVDSHLLVFINGIYSPKLSYVFPLEQGTKIGSLAEAIRDDSDKVNPNLAKVAPYNNDAFTALSTAFMRDGAFIYVPKGIEIEMPIHLLYLSTTNDGLSLSLPRNLIITGDNTRLSIIETYASLNENEYFTNTVTEIVLGKNSILEHDKLQIEHERSYHVSSAHIRQDAKSKYTSNSISFGGALTRNNISALLNAEGCECTLNGLSLATGQQHFDNHTTIDHAKPNCVSHELYKSIIDGKARGVFNGKIFVRKDAQKTDAKQTNKTLLLSDEATIDTKPQLEIFADDVKCTHGAAVGQLDEEQIFYLQTRGIGLETARDLLTFAFAADVVQRIQINQLREQLHQMLNVRLQKGRELLSD